MPIWLTAILAICRIANVGRVDLYDFSGDEFGKWITAGTHVPLCQSFRGCDAHACPRRRPAELLQHPAGLTDKSTFKRFIAPLRRMQIGVVLASCP